MTQKKSKTKSWKNLRAEWLADPEIARAYERIGPTMEVAFALAEARHAAGLTQVDVAERMGTSQAAVARMERGQVAPSWTSIQKYARAVGRKPVLELVAGE